MTWAVTWAGAPSPGARSAAALRQGVQMPRGGVSKVNWTETACMLGREVSQALAPGL